MGWRENWIKSGLCFTRLHLMRILDLSYANFKGGKLPFRIGKLIHLRYLSLFLAEASHLPSSMRNLKQLLYLNLHVSARSPIYMAPSFLKEMRELTYLYLPRGMHEKTKLELGNLVNLETLENFSTKHSSVKDLQRMTKLRNLSIDVIGTGCTMETLSSYLSELRHLEDLTIEGYTNDEEGFVLDCVHLKKLKLSIYMPKLPDEQQFLSRLTLLDLEDCRLEEDPMPILEKLVELKELVLGRQSFNGRRMVCSNGGFLQLQKLELDRLHWLEEWMVDEGSMPLLHSLTICHCPKLKELTDGQHLPSHLTTITLEHCGLEEDPMPILEKLLHLKEFRLWDRSFAGRKMVCSNGGFPQLQKLELKGLEEWEEWIVEEGSMPVLHSLRILRCQKLKELPDGLKFITSLKNLRMDEKWKKRLSEGGESYYKVKHIPSVKFY